jgi:hypothetical protein
MRARLTGRIALVSIVGLLGSANGLAQNVRKSPAKADAPTEAKPRTLLGITWQPGVADALKLATPASSRNPAKPVLVLRMLGDLGGLC